MARKQRVEYPGAFYHGIMRGNRKAAIFKVVITTSYPDFRFQPDPVSARFGYAAHPQGILAEV